MLLHTFQSLPASHPLLFTQHSHARSPTHSLAHALGPPRGGARPNRFFGGGFGQQQQEEEQTPKGHTVHADLEVTLEDLYLGRSFKVNQ